MIHTRPNETESSDPVIGPRSYSLGFLPHCLRTRRLMAGRKGFENLEPIFGEAKAEFVQQEQQHASLIFTRPFLFYVHALDPSRLEILASDFHSHTFARTLTVHQLDDLRDDIGIGGSWSEFVDYLMASLSSGTVKVIMDSAANMPIDSSEVHAKLIAHKSKGLPRISLPLSKLMNSSANDAMANFSLALFKALKDKQNDSIKEHEYLLQVKGLLSSEKERSESLQKQLDGLSFVNKRKVHKSKTSDKISFVTDSATDNNTTLVSETQPPTVSQTQPPIANYPADVVVQPSVKDTQPPKVSHRAVPVSRRAKTRGVSLNNCGDDDN